MPNSDPFDFDGKPLASATPPAVSIAAPTPAPIPMQWSPTCDGCGKVLTDRDEVLCPKCKAPKVTPAPPKARVEVLPFVPNTTPLPPRRSHAPRARVATAHVSPDRVGPRVATVRPDLAKDTRAATVYRDLAADTSGKYRGQICQRAACGQSIGAESYSGTDGSHHCSKRCYLADEGLISPPPARTGPEVERADGTRVRYARGYDPKAAAYEETQKSGQVCKPVKSPRAVCPSTVAGIPRGVKITLAELWDFLTKSAREWERQGDAEQAANVRAYRDLVFKGPEGEVSP